LGSFTADADDCGHDVAALYGGIGIEVGVALGNEMQPVMSKPAADHAVGHERRLDPEEHDVAALYILGRNAADKNPFAAADSSAHTATGGPERNLRARLQGFLDQIQSHQLPGCGVHLAFC